MENSRVVEITILNDDGWCDADL